MRGTNPEPVRGTIGLNYASTNPLLVQSYPAYRRWLQPIMQPQHMSPNGSVLAPNEEEKGPRSLESSAWKRDCRGAVRRGKGQMLMTCFSPMRATPYHRVVVGFPARVSLPAVVYRKIKTSWRIPWGAVGENNASSRPTTRPGWT